MSEDDQGGDRKGFLARWSQRKREAKPPDRDALPAEADLRSGPVAEGGAEPEFDLSSLPKLEDLTATTDITAFLGKGVPESVRNAALRKSWALDPAIRNYVNPALDYAYDWNTPGGVPGSSELGAGMDVARMVLQIMGSGESAAEPSAVGPGKEPAGDPGQATEHIATQEQEAPPELPTQPLRLGSETISTAQNTSNFGVGDHEAGPPRDSKEESDSAAPQQAVRRHGSAKPIV